MRDQWVGDQRDYMKYFILRKLATHLPIQVCWMLWREDKISYLDEPERHRGLDEGLYDGLAEIVSNSTRTTKEVAEKLFGDQGSFEVSFFRDSFGGRAATREQYFRKLLDQAEPRELLFFDPDTGLQPRPNGEVEGKHLRWRELEIVTSEGAGHSLAIYQHRVRQNPDAFRVEELRNHLPKFEVFGLHSREVDAALLIAARPDDAQKLRGGAEDAMSDWNGWAEEGPDDERRHRLDYIGSA